MLTPAFHFKILEDFMPIFNRESFKLVNIIKTKHGDGSTFDFAPYITKCTLDIICGEHRIIYNICYKVTNKCFFTKFSVTLMCNISETAMGKTMNAQDGGNLEYTQAIRECVRV